MRTGLCHTRVKYLLLAFNFLLWLHGMAIVGFGIWILVSIFDPDEGYPEIKDDEVDQVLKIVGGTLIAGGCAIVIVGIIGCHGTIKENPCRLLGYSISLFIIFACLLGTGVVIIINKAVIEDEVTKTLNKTSSTSKVLWEKCSKDAVKACTASFMRYPTIVAGLSIGFAQVMILGLVFSLSFHCTK